MNKLPEWQQRQIDRLEMNNHQIAAELKYALEHDLEELPSTTRERQRAFYKPRENNEPPIFKPRRGLRL